MNDPINQDMIALLTRLAIINTRWSSYQTTKAIGEIESVIIAARALLWTIENKIERDAENTVHPCDSCGVSVRQVDSLGHGEDYLCPDCYMPPTSDEDIEHAAALDGHTVRDAAEDEDDHDPDIVEATTSELEWAMAADPLVRDVRFEDTDTDDHTVEVGSIFVCSWGYDQTNVDFYAVTRRTAKTVWLRAIEKEIVYDHEDGLPNSTEYVKPSSIPGQRVVWAGSEIDGIRRALNEPTDDAGTRAAPWVKISSYSTARLWNGKMKAQTGGSGGH